MRTPTLKLNIGDTKWKVKLLSVKQYEADLGEDSYALTDTDLKIIYFKTNAIDLPTCLHEMFHGYFTLTHVDSANLSKDDTEEVVASLIGKYGVDLVESSKKVHNWLKKEVKKYEFIES